MNLNINTYEGQMFVGYDKYIEQMTERFKSNLDDIDPEVKKEIDNLYLYSENKTMETIQLLLYDIIENKKAMMKNMHDGRIAQDKIIVEERLIKTYESKIEELKKKKLWKLFHKNKVKEFEEAIIKSKDILEKQYQLLEALDETAANIMSKESELFLKLAYLDSLYGEQ